MISFEFLLAWDFVYQGTSTLISLDYQNMGHARVVATNLKQKEYA
jgi:hypothetical protein